MERDPMPATNHVMRGGKLDMRDAAPMDTPRITALKTKIASTIRMLQLLNDSVESVERGNPRLDKAQSDLRDVATMCGDLRVELASR